MTAKRPSRSLVLSLLLVTALAFPALAGWRTDGTGKYPKAKPPAKWSTTEAVLWKTPLPGWSNATPVLHKDLLFVCREPDVLVCMDAAAGKVLWEARNGYTDVLPPRTTPPPPLPATHGTTGYSSPTPLVHGKKVYALFGNGVASCFDLKGKRVWSRFVGMPTHSWGHSASPVVAGGRIVAHVGPYVYALDPETGAEAWKAQSASNWGTPAVFPLGRSQAILTTGGDVVAAADGKVLARAVAPLPWTSPVLDQGVLYVVDEGGAFALRVPKGPADPLVLEKAWHQPAVPRDRYYASPVIHEGLVYAVTQSGQLTALDAATGAVAYSQRLNLGGGTFYPSICLAGGRIYVSSDSGQTAVVVPGRTFVQEATLSLEPFRSTPVFSGGRVYVRTLSALYCLGK